jgi:hypothetical protein
MKHYVLGGKKITVARVLSCGLSLADCMIMKGKDYRLKMIRVFV